MSSIPASLYQFKCLRAFAGLLWLLLWAPAICLANETHVEVVLSGNAAPYQEFVISLKRQLPENIELSVLESPGKFPDSSKSPDLIVAVGQKAADWVSSRTQLPVLATMIFSSSYESLLSSHNGGQISGVFVDQPLERQLRLLHYALPQSRHIGVLLSRQSDSNLEVLRSQLKNQGDTLVAEHVDASTPLFQSLEDLLVRSDVLFVLPDRAIYNSNTIRNILLSSYRHKVPLIGLSNSYVNAGALCAIYSTPQQLAIQTKEIIVQFGHEEKLPAASYPEYFKVAVNHEVATMLDISIHSAAQLELLVKKEERVSDAEQ